jgi:hypothetical protein
MSQQPFQPSPTTSAKPFNRRLVAQGRVLPPAGGLSVESHKHLVTQERIGVCLALAALYGVVYGVQRGDLLAPLYVVSGVATALCCLERWSAREAALSARTATLAARKAARRRARQGA